MPIKKGKSSKIQSENISEIMSSFDKTGKIGNSKPKNKDKAHEQAVAIALREANKDKKK